MRPGLVQKDALYSPGPQNYGTVMSVRSGQTMAYMGKPTQNEVVKKTRSPAVGAYNVAESFDALSPRTTQAFFPSSSRGTPKRA
jgi:hypothetical protein